MFILKCLCNYLSQSRAIFCVTQVIKPAQLSVLIDESPRFHAYSRLMPDTVQSRKSQSKSYKYTLALGALGVVYGDIGTSPLYALKEALINRSL